MNASTLVIISGVSGSGKSTALNAFEDLGYFCIDNLPAKLLDNLVDFLLHLPEQHAVSTDLVAPAKAVNSLTVNYKRFALLTDCREEQAFDEMRQAISRLEAAGTEVRLLYFDCQDDVILHRFRETRRPHPLLVVGAGKTIVEVLEQERELLADFRESAGRVIDTTNCSPHDLRRLIENMVGRDPSLEVTIVSFGFKYGIPHDADLVVDVRFLPNPYFEAGLHEKTGLDREVIDFVFGKDDAIAFLERYVSLLKFLLPRYLQEGKRYVTVAVGCTGGRHRSVAIAERLAGEINQPGLKLAVKHRDLARHS